MFYLWNIYILVFVLVKYVIYEFVYGALMVDLSGLGSTR